MRVLALLFAPMALLAHDLSTVMSYQGHSALSLLLNQSRLVKRAGPFGVVNVTVCNDASEPVTLSTARVDAQIEEHGTAVLAAPLVAALLQRRDTADWRRITVEVVKYAAFGLTLYAAAYPDAKIRSIRIAAPAAAVALQQVTDRVNKGLPPALIESLGPLFLAKDIPLAPGGCGQILRVIHWRKDLPAIRKGTIVVPATK